MDTLDIIDKATVLVVDDTPAHLFMISSLLRDSYKVKVSTSGGKALNIVREAPPPDLILLDVMMPGVSGHEVIRELKASAATHDIPVIFLTAKEEVEEERAGLELGAVDYITKPVSPPVLLARVANHLQAKAATDFLRVKNEYLENAVAKGMREISTMQDVVVLAMTSLAETRDNETGNHTRRTQFYVKALAERLKTHPRFCNFLSRDTIEKLFKSAPLHDIGKVGIPDSILLKPGRLTLEEFAIMQTHTTLGRDAIVQAEKILGTQVDFLRLAKEIAYCHHEKWDGSGYPQGICGDDIPISARLMTIADVYDGLVSSRVYKAGMPHQKAVQIMTQGRGSHFDPDIFDAFLELQDEFKAIAARFADSDDDLIHKASMLSTLAH